MNANQNTGRYVAGAICVAINIVLGMVIGALKVPFYGDTIGTIMAAVLMGPGIGALVGLLSSILNSILFQGLQSIPFALINVMIGLVVGWAARKRTFSMPFAVGMGVLLSFLCALVGTPIGVAVYGGLTGTVSDILVGFLTQSGAGIFASSFVAKVGNNLIDKIGSCVIVCMTLKYLPLCLRGQMLTLEKN